MAALNSAPITVLKRSDLRIFLSERQTDNPDGGGMPTGTPLTGADNELFPPISYIQRLNGTLMWRGLYAGVRRADDEPLYGSFVAITKPPVDKYISYLLFKAAKFGEIREEAIKRIEAYSVGTIESRMRLLSTQTQGSRIIQAYQRVDEPLPLVGDRYQLKQEKAGYPQLEQYVQITDVDSEVRTFTNVGKAIKVLVVKMEITQPLDHDYIGASYPQLGYDNVPCKLLETHVADAGMYYGVKPLSIAMDKTVAKAKVPSIFEKIIPTSQIETQLLDLNANGNRKMLFDSTKAGSFVTQQINNNVSLNSEYYLGNGITPGSLSVICSGGSDIIDKGGALMRDSSPVGTVDYAESTLRFFAGQSIQLISARFKAAVADTSISDTAKIGVSIQNRSLNYIINIDPIANRGSIVASYRAQGRRYELRDNGDGKLVGASPAHGSGNFDSASGTVSITCGALPDIGSAVIFSWGNSARYINRSDISSTQPVLAKLEFYLSSEAESDNINFAWSGGTATCDASGNITGGMTGKYHAQDKRVSVNMNSSLNLPSAGFEVTASYQKLTPKSAIAFNSPLRDPAGTITLSLGTSPIKPNTVKMIFDLNVEDYDYDVMEGQLGQNWVKSNAVTTDDGAGKLVDANGNQYATIDYATGTIVLTPETTITIPKARYSKTVISSGGRVTLDGPSGGTVTYPPRYRSVFSHYEYIPTGASFPLSGGNISVEFNDNSPATSATETITDAKVRIDLTTAFAEQIASKSLRFSFSNRVHYDKNGAIYADLNPATKAATLVGNVDYAEQQVILSSWGAGSDVTVEALATTVNSYPVDAVTFTTPVSPIRPSSMTIKAIATDGTDISCTADANGKMTSAFTRGDVDVEYGVVDIEFGELIVAAGNESESWFDPAAVDTDGKIWKPKHIVAETLTYSAVAYRFMPVDSSVVKIDTVRLPQDGNVPIYRRGDTVYISNTEKQDIGSAHTAGQTVTLSRSNVNRICVVDANDKPVLADWWNYDLSAGSITWSTPLDLSAYTLPITVRNTLQEGNRIATLDIDGTLDLMFLPKHDYPKENTYVSSVLVGGDLQVRFSEPFSQRSWSDQWLDYPVGVQPLNKLNLTVYPMVLTDDGAITERWMIKFTGSNTFELYGEELGYVISGDTLTDLQPINPFTGKPYMTIAKEAFGNQAPWATHDVIRFNTWGTLLPFSIICAGQPTNVPVSGSDGVVTCIFGDTTLL